MIAHCSLITSEARGNEYPCIKWHGHIVVLRSSRDSSTLTRLGACREERERVLVSSGRVQHTDVHTLPLDRGDPGAYPSLHLSCALVTSILVKIVGNLVFTATSL
jgi:hypothetical protein